MERSRWRTFVFWVVLVEAVGLLSGYLSREGAVNFRELVSQPPLSPPGVVFPVVWSILYALMGISAARICLELPSKERGRGLALFILQLAVNFIWSPVFFVVNDFGAAFLLVVVLWGLVFAMIRQFNKTDPVAAVLQIPYLIWLTFAGYLSAGIWILNFDPM